MELQDFENLKIKALKNEHNTRLFFKKLKNKKPKNLDSVVQELDYEVFQKIDCLSCANCCRTLGPRILQKDIERISHNFKISESDFIEKYLRIDEDNDYVFKTMPCPFLESDNYCLIYEYRPKACREYPHTSQRRFYQVLDETALNRAICPAVYEIVEQLKDKFKF